MAGDDRPSDPAEERDRRTVRKIAGYTLLALIVVLALADTFGRSADLHANEFIFSALVGAFLLVVGVEAGARWFGGSGKR